MISISAPSYVCAVTVIDVPNLTDAHLLISSNLQSQHETTFIGKLVVSPADFDGKAKHQAFKSSASLVAEQPPFGVIGHASEPFIARIQVDWVGGPSKPLQVTHYVRVRYERISAIDR